MNASTILARPSTLLPEYSISPAPTRSTFPRKHTTRASKLPSRPSKSKRRSPSCVALSKIRGSFASRRPQLRSHPGSHRRRLSLMLLPGPTVGVSGIFLRGFPLEFFGILLQSILVGRLRKAGGKTTGALCFGASIVGFGIGHDTAPCQGQRGAGTQRCEQSTKQKRSATPLARLRGLHPLPIIALDGFA